MSSEAFDHKITEQSDSKLYVTKGWVHFWAHLESAAGGKNEISYGAEFVPIEPGTTISHLVGPGTVIRLKTSSSADVQWAVLITEISIMDLLESSLCQGGQ